MNAALVMTLLWLEAKGLGLLRMVSLRPFTTAVITLVLLDFSFYVADVAMHIVPGFWRYHRVHHADPPVDVTTSIRQHPGESVIRHAFMAAFAFGIGASPGAFVVYRVWSGLNGLLEHANIRLPLWLDGLLSSPPGPTCTRSITREPHEANTNYGNIFSLFDRLFSTFTPSKRGTNVVTGSMVSMTPPCRRPPGCLACRSGTSGQDAEPRLRSANCHERRRYPHCSRIASLGVFG